MSSNGTATQTAQERLQARLADPQTVDTLNRLLDRADVLAFSLEMVDGFLQRSPVVIDSVADTVAELRDGLEKDGSGNLIEKIPALARAGVRMAETTASPAFERVMRSGLLERLGDPRTIESLKSLLDRLEVAAFTLQALDEFLGRADVIANSVADSVSEIRESASPEGAKILESLPQLAATGAHLAEVAKKPEFVNLLSLVDKVGKPETVEKLGMLLEKLDLAVFTLNALDGLIKRGPQVADSIAEGVAELRGMSPELDGAKLKELGADLLKFIEVGRKVAASGLLDKLDELANTGLALSAAGMFEPKIVKALGEVGRMASESYNEARKAPPKRIGILGMLKLLNDPAAQPTLSLLAESAKRFGDKLK